MDERIFAFDMRNGFTYVGKAKDGAAHDNDPTLQEYLVLPTESLFKISRNPGSSFTSAVRAEYEGAEELRLNKRVTLYDENIIATHAL